MAARPGEAAGVATEIGNVGRSVIGLIIMLGVAALMLSIMGAVAEQLPGSEVTNATTLFKPLVDPWSTFVTLLIYGGILAIIVFIFWKGMAQKL